MNPMQAMQQRASVREFLPEPIPSEQIWQLVEAAGHAPSSKNTQPWSLFLLQGKALEALRQEYLAAFDAGEAPRQQYRYSPNPLPESWAARAKQNGISLFKHKDIGRDDKEKRRLHDRENYRFFGAPQVFFLGTQEGSYAHGTTMDCGFVLNNLMLGLVDMGYGSCPMYSAVSYPDILKRHIPGSEGILFLAGLACGRPLPDSHVNAFRTVREPLQTWFKVIE